MASAQDRIQALFDRLVEKGPERGLQLVAYRHGKKVVDVSAGVADVDTGSRVDAETLFPVFSVTKAVAATIVHILAEKALLAYDRPIAEYWPEFAANGKERITLRHVLAHESGLYLMPTGLDFAQVCDWQTVCAAIAQLRPTPATGNRASYHALTFGWILGETACRVTGKTFPQLLDEEIKRPLGLTDFYVGIPDSDSVAKRIAADYDQPDPERPRPDDPAPSEVPAWMLPLGAIMNRPDIRRSCGPAYNGIMNARSLARFYAALLAGGIDGVELLPPRRIREMTRQETLLHVPTLEYPRRLGLGYFLGGLGTPEMSLRLDAFGHGGYGASLGYADPSVGLAVGFTKNYLALDAAVRIEVMQSLRKALRISED